MRARKSNLKKTLTRISTKWRQDPFTILKTASLGTIMILTVAILTPSTSVKVQAFSNSINPADSSVAVTFMTSSTSASLRPTTSVGQSARINIQAKVEVKNSGGYAVYLKANNADLIGVNDATHKIPSTSSARTYEDMDINTWGYYAAEGTTIPSTATYKPLLASENGNKIAENTETKIESETKHLILSFATKLNNETPADSYQNVAVMSVVSSPIEVALTWDEIAEMQQMTSEICTSAVNGASKQLKDVRDGKYYWITKLEDGKCWMTQNLDLDITTAGLNSETSDIGYNNGDYPEVIEYWNGSSAYPPVNTAATATSSTIFADDTGTHSWNLGAYRITSPLAANNCGSGKNTGANCSSQLTAYATPTTANGDLNSHYILGNFYQWNTAVAGSGGSEFKSDDAPSSICPKNWRLPTTKNTNEFTNLTKIYNVYISTNASDVAAITSAPMYFARSGYVSQDSGYLFSYAGDSGRLWSSTANQYSDGAYYLSFSGTKESLGNINVHSSANYMHEGPTRMNGYSVRCIAR